MRHVRAAASLPLLLGLLLTVLPVASPRAAAQEADDPFLWLEEVEGERAMAWVEERNAETLSELTGLPIYDSLFAETLEILNSAERIAYPSIMGGRLYNFWTDAEHERGIWRRTTWESYLGGDPQWEILLDIDALAEEEGVNWAFRGANCLPPEYRRCLVNLSRGGADATEIRELDLETGDFLEDGFFLPEAKTSVAWRDLNTLLVSTDFGEGTLTTSGYPSIVKIWRRGTPLEDAVTIFEAAPTDMGVWVGSDETARERFTFVSHRPSFFRATNYLVEGEELREIEVPMDADLSLVDDQLVLYLRSPWEVGGTTYPQGAVLSIGRADFLDGDRAFEVVVQPGPTSTVESIRTTRDHLLIGVLDDVRSQLWRYERHAGEWVGEKIPAPELGTLSVGSTDAHTDRFFLNFSSYTQPSTLYLVDEAGGLREVRQMPEMFDAEGLVVEQHHATSRDGTRVPFFIVHPEGIAHDGTNPTLLYGYGGFEISMTPGYSSTVGRSWLERGGVYVVANIRGGGEFGPAWHRSAQRENRQRAYDDFLAVAEFLIDHGVTSPDHLGIQGGSNGGLLVGVAMTQRPDLFDAVVVQVPLLDMRRYNKLLAGASWMAEYGDPDDPDDWAFIREYSPYQNVEADADYPRPFFTTTTRDDRVHPGHARKMAALMRSMDHPIYYYENTEGGHGSGVTPEQRARMYALVYTYLWRHLGAESPAADEGGR